MTFKIRKVKPIKLLDTTKSYYIFDVEIAIVHKTSALLVDSYNCLLFIQCTVIFKMVRLIQYLLCDLAKTND